MRLQTCGYISSRRATLSSDRYQITLLGDRGARVNNLPKVFSQKTQGPAVERLTGVGEVALGWSVAGGVVPATRLLGALLGVDADVAARLAMRQLGIAAARRAPRLDTHDL